MRFVFEERRNGQLKPWSRWPGNSCALSEPYQLTYRVAIALAAPGLRAYLTLDEFGLNF